MRIRAMALVCAAVLLTSTLGAQAPPTFEVASVKPSPPGAARGPIGFSGERINVTAWTLSELMVLLYGQSGPLYRFQITGGPDWIDRERFDVTATISPSRPPDPSVLPEMMKALLADRFKLLVREETKEGPTYSLTLVSREGQLGPKLRRATAVLCPEPGSPPPPPPSGPDAPRCDYRIGYGTLVGRGVSIKSLSQSMANFYGVGRVIVDKTGLSGGFDMDME
jgi:uncharacterized protein (TIGR03435 family)